VRESTPQRLEQTVKFPNPRSELRYCLGRPMLAGASGRPTVCHRFRQTLQFDDFTLQDGFEKPCLCRVGERQCTRRDIGR
jgi:hypothetical protein